MWHTVSQHSFVKNFGTIKNQKGWKFERFIKLCMKYNIIRFIACKQVKTKIDFEKTYCDLLFSIHYLRDTWINHTV